MEQTLFEDQLICLFRENCLDKFITPDIIEQFKAFTALLQEANAHTNLTSIREVPDIIAKHYADCLIAESFFPQGAAVLDVGCGGGFPTIPLSIARRDLHLTAIDSTEKKIAFVRSAAKALRLENITTICSRVEDKAMKSFSQTFDVGTSRAVAKMSILSELVLPYVKVGGYMVALKGANGEAELNEAKAAIRMLGGEVQDVLHKRLICSGLTEERTVILIQKMHPSPSQYPRQYATILKRPL